jgi:hypothetical protein
VPSKTFATGDILTASDLNTMNADPQSADVVTEQTTTSTGYGDLTTTGPSVTLSLNNGQKVLVVVTASIYGAGAGVDFGRASFAVSGATTLAASDANAASNRLGSNVIAMVSRTTVFTATATGSHTFKMVYKTTNAATTANFLDRRIVVMPKF